MQYDGSNSGDILTAVNGASPVILSETGGVLTIEVYGGPDTHVLNTGDWLIIDPISPSIVGGPILGAEFSARYVIQ